MPPSVLDVNIMDEMSVKIQNYSETASGNMLIFYNKVKEDVIVPQPRQNDHQILSPLHHAEGISFLV